MIEVNKSGVQIWIKQRKKKKPGIFEEYRKKQSKNRVQSGPDFIFSKTFK